MERQYQCLRCGHDSRTHECEQIAHAKMVDLQRALDAEREKVKELENVIRNVEIGRVEDAEVSAHITSLYEQLATLQAQFADRDAMILQMGEQAAVLAKENMAVKAQLRQVEGQSKQQAEEAVIVFAKYTTLRQLVEVLPVIERFDVGVDDHGGEIRLPDGYILFTATSRDRTYALDKLLQYRATLAAQDAGKEDVSHE